MLLRRCTVIMQHSRSWHGVCSNESRHLINRLNFLEASGLSLTLCFPTAAVPFNSWGLRGLQRSPARFQISQLSMLSSSHTTTMIILIMLPSRKSRNITLMRGFLCHWAMHRGKRALPCLPCIPYIADGWWKHDRCYRRSGEYAVR